MTLLRWDKVSLQKFLVPDLISYSRELIKSSGCALSQSSAFLSIMDEPSLFLKSRWPSVSDAISFFFFKKDNVVTYSATMRQYRLRGAHLHHFKYTMHNS